MRRNAWPLVGLGLGSLGGVLWGWLGSGGYEAGDSALGTGLLGAILGLVLGVGAFAVAGRGGNNRS